MIVIKIGGSLLNNEKLKECLTTIINQQNKSLIVPGGGVFANLVREEQKTINFDDLTAHNLSILSMMKVGYILHSMIPNNSRIIRSENELYLLEKNKIGIWCSDSQITNAKNEFTNWRITSDTIALNLSKRIGARMLIIIKSCDIINKKGPISSMKLTTKKTIEFSQKNILDRGFPKFFSLCSFPVFVISINQPEFLSDLLINF